MYCRLFITEANKILRHVRFHHVLTESSLLITISEIAEVYILPLSAMLSM